MNISRSFALAAFSVLLPLTIGCTVAVNRNKDGGDKNVKIDTPLGGVHVTSDDTTAADVGLPVYPGAHVSSKKDGDKSADIHFGFGDWQFRIKVVKYETSDSSDQVLAFYKKALGRYGDVIQCKDHTAIGSPSVTREGLSCQDSDDERKIKVSSDGNSSLKAGSKRHQHILAIEKSDGPNTSFSLVQLDLPISSDGDKPESN